MTKAPKDKDQEKGDEVLRRLLKTPPDHRTGNKPVNRPLTKTNAKRKPGGNPAKNNRPEGQ
ncbi:MAG: hypothetical protein EOQ42_26730 [Mesorhizobium sp.]|uniref:hypothetical protein n=1 Tax=Mesorhizobium sp. TaxID=1871066 RepID=UPI000FE46360|nr:hypothetical protein [Mesorhizobium sp.]RWB30549.1 MAG: hypothetical protein EOQ43_15485 [Mesorhizobium sp.]RWB50541.1 MAG: hypothetical protein EOQ42_26730 [Mesorhizobium sp.]RWD04982.1 MAG: hypothetical protein EOS57_25810 [Mesorhizobium sp.]